MHPQVHQRDVFMDLTRLYKERKINSSSDFEWLKQARFYWRPGEDDAHGAGSCVISICDVDFKYRFEYLGCKVKCCCKLALPLLATTIPLRTRRPPDRCSVHSVSRAACGTAPQVFFHDSKSPRHQIIIPNVATPPLFLIHSFAPMPTAWSTETDHRSDWSSLL